MKKRILLVLGSMILITCGIHIINFDKDDEIIRDKENVEELPLVGINFPEYGGEFNNDIEFQINENYQIKNKEILSKFYVISNQNLDDRIEKVIEHYKIVDNEKCIDDTVTIGDANGRVTKYGDTSFQYVNNKGDDISIKVDDKKCIEIAETELNKLGLLESDMQYSGIAYDVLTNLQTGEETIIGKTVYFNREIENIEVKGNSKVCISIVDEGDINMIYYGRGELSDVYEVGENNIIPLDEVLESCEELNGYINMPQETELVVIENIECVYWEDSTYGSENNTIQPVYKITGRAYCKGEYCGDYIAVEQALKK